MKRERKNMITDSEKKGNWLGITFLSFLSFYLSFIFIMEKNREKHSSIRKSMKKENCMCVIVVRKLFEPYFTYYFHSVSRRKVNFFLFINWHSKLASFYSIKSSSKDKVIFSLESFQET